MLESSDVVTFAGAADLTRARLTGPADRAG